MPDLRAVVFDYGHTLLNFARAESALLAFYEGVRAELIAGAEDSLPDAPGLLQALTGGVELLVRESYIRQELEELDMVDLFARTFASLGITPPRDWLREFAEREHRAFVSELSVPPENLRVLETLRERGLRLGLVSNAHFLPELMREDITRLGIAPHLDDAVFSAEIGVRKPDPAIFGKVLDELDVAPEQAIFVGDRVRDDIAGAKSLGMRGVLTHQFRQEDPAGAPFQPDLVINALSEIVPYVETLTP